MKALEETKAELDTYLAKERAFDIKTRDLCFAGHRGQQRKDKPHGGFAPFQMGYVN